MNRIDFLALPYDERIMKLVEDPEAAGLPEDASFIAQYLSRFRPANPPAAGLDNESSVDIAETLQSVGLIDPKTVSSVMRLLGYKLYFQGVSQPLWSMKHIDSLSD